MKAWI